MNKVVEETQYVSDKIKNINKVNLQKMSAKEKRKSAAEYMEDTLEYSGSIIKAKVKKCY